MRKRKKSDSPSRTNSYSPVGQVVSNYLATADMSQKALSEAIGKSPVYTSHIMMGRAMASPQWCNLVSNALNLSDDEAKTLNMAAASSAGYNLGFSLDFSKK